MTEAEETKIKTIYKKQFSADSSNGSNHSSTHKKYVQSLAEYYAALRDSPRKIKGKKRFLSQLTSEIIEGCGSLVQSRIKRFYRLLNERGEREYPVLWKDLDQEGKIGVNLALGKYDPKEGTFTNYACYWIDERIRKFIASNYFSPFTPFRYDWDNLEKINKAKRYFSKKKIDPSIDQLRELAGIPEKTMSKVSALPKKTISLDAPITKDKDNTLEDFIGTEPAIEEETEKSQLQETLVKILGDIPERRRRILFKYYLVEETLEKIGKRERITRERVRQLRNKSLKSFREIMERKGLTSVLREYLD